MALQSWREFGRNLTFSEKFSFLSEILQLVNNKQKFFHGVGIGEFPGGRAGARQAGLPQNCHD